MTRINVTKTFLPPIEEYETYLKKIWDNGQLTNQGPLLLEFEDKISNYLGVNNFHFVTNGTVALQVALRALDITEGEIITTPFSYVATTSAILWERCQPVFIDINPDTFCIDADKIEASITPETKAILAVHVFGYPCEIEKIEAIAKAHNIKVIYDAAHAFGVDYKGKSLLDYGDISICSFHATKVFHTIEGGCVIARDKEVSAKIEQIKRFGHTGDTHYMLGVNAKASEFQAAMGLVNIKYVPMLIAKRRTLYDSYTKLLGKKFSRPLPSDTKYNYAYYPILLESEAKLLQTIKALNDKDIFPRRYFYPSLNRLPYLDKRSSCPVSEGIASRIICLPFYPDLDEAVVAKICAIVLENNEA